jgi:phosphoribosylanthranilate isomerase
MTPPRIKICGITELRDALFCVQAGADYLGFIFYEKSPRHIAPAKAKMIIAELPDSVVPVGVFVNANRWNVRDTVDAAGIRLLQMSGDETPEECQGYDIPVWKSFRIRDARRVESVRAFRVDAALLDGAGEGEYGGAGKLADPSIGRSMSAYHRVVLAGGLTPENVRDAVAAARPFAVDVSSGVESSPGKKDEMKVTEFVRQVTHNS